MQQGDGGLLFLLGGETQEEQKAQALASPRTSQGDALPSSSAYGNKENQLQGPPPAISRGCRRRKWNNQWIINIPHKAGASSRPLPGVLRTAATRAGAGVAGCHGAGMRRPRWRNDSTAWRTLGRRAHGAEEDDALAPLGDYSGGAVPL